LKQAKTDSKAAKWLALLFCVGLNPRQQLNIAAAFGDFLFQRVGFEADEIEEMPSMLLAPK
jgi:hypothetical protein